MDLWLQFRRVLYRQGTGSGLTLIASQKTRVGDKREGESQRSVEAVAAAESHGPIFSIQSAKAPSFCASRRGW